jgi:hypothetical protein
MAERYDQERGALNADQIHVENKANPYANCGEGTYMGFGRDD